VEQHPHSWSYYPQVVVLKSAGLELLLRN